MKLSFQLVPRFFTILVVILHFVSSASSQITLKEISLIKIVIPEKFKTDYDLLVKIGNSGTAKALDEAFSGFLSKLDDVTAQSILYLIKDKPEKNALKLLLKERDNYCFWHPLVSMDIDDYYENLVMLADSIDEDGFRKHVNVEPHYLKYDTFSTHLVYLDRKILMEKYLFWNNQTKIFHQLTALEDRLAVLPNEIEQATSNVRYFSKNHDDEFPKSEAHLKAENKLTQLFTEQEKSQALQKKIFYEMGINKQAEYKSVKTLLADEDLIKLPDLILKLRI